MSDSAHLRSLVLVAQSPDRLLEFEPYLTSTRTCPAVVGLMVPAHWQARESASLSAAWPSMSTWPDPGVQGAGRLGTQGWGVSTPCAAAVAVAT